MSAGDGQPAGFERLKAAIEASQLRFTRSKLQLEALAVTSVLSRSPPSLVLCGWSRPGVFVLGGCLSLFMAVNKEPCCAFGLVCVGGAHGGVPELRRRDDGICASCADAARWRLLA